MSSDEPLLRVIPPRLITASWTVRPALLSCSDEVASTTKPSIVTGEILERHIRVVTKGNVLVRDS